MGTGDQRLLIAPFEDRPPAANLYNRVGLPASPFSIKVE